MTIKQAIRFTKDKLIPIYDEGEARNIATWVIEYLTGYDKTMHAHAASLEMHAGHEKDLDYIIDRLLKHEPVQYVLGEAWFYGIKFMVNKHVLIPRPETEELVHWILADYKEDSPLKILDIGTGSGCIAITLKKKLPSAEVTAIDISENALSVANHNAAEKKADIRFLQIDFLDINTWGEMGQFDIIVSNPPYVTLKERPDMQQNVLSHEPETALFVPDEDPLIFYRAIAEFGKTHLTGEGKIYCELNAGLGIETQQLFNQYGYTSELKLDMQGNQRMIKLYNP